MKTLRTVILAITGIFSIACAPKDLSARTGEGREGESLYKDQQFTVGEVSFLAY
jgi:hypothetical protein